MTRRRFDDYKYCVIQNEHNNADSQRTQVYRYLENHRGATIEEIVNAIGIRRLRVTDCVKKLFYDGKIKILDEECRPSKLSISDLPQKAATSNPQARKNETPSTDYFQDSYVPAEAKHLRESLYSLYLALHQAKQNCPNEFSDGRLTTILTSIMGLENHGWRVVGITKQALQKYSDNNFKHPPKCLCRGHVVDRVETTRRLFKSNIPEPIDIFFDIFIKNDCTVIMLNEQNRNQLDLDCVITIDNPNGELFPNTGFIGWKYRKAEQNFLRQLHSNLHPLEVNEGASA